MILIKFLTLILVIFTVKSDSRKIPIFTKEDGFTPATPTVKDHSTPKILEKCDPCPKNIKCVPHIQCPAHVTMKHNQRPQMCELPGGTHGLCCTTGQNHTSKLHFSKERFANLNMVPEMMNKLVDEARSEFSSILKQEPSFSPLNQPGEPEFIHNMVFRSPAPLNMMRNIAMSHRAYEEVLASRLYKKRQNIPTEDFQYESIDGGFEGTSLENNCENRQSCTHSSKFRTMDGSCNNLDPQKALWGAAGHPMERLLPPAYEDGIWLPRIHSVDGSLLTSPRIISRNIFDDINRPHSKYNLLLMQFGQFISHDVTQTSSHKLSDGKDISCCSEDGSEIIPESMRHYSCLPIEIGVDDNFYRTFNQGCINFVRSSLAPRDGCKMGYAKQLSKVTHYLDGSMIYGSDVQTVSEVRSYYGGRLRIFDDFGHQLLPLNQEKNACLSMERGSGCFFAGDGRVNQIISLTGLHILFLREHNRVADILSDINRHWSDELLFLETRRIIVAKYQQIIFKEWLPLVIGTETMNKFGLNTLHSGYSTDYSADINACITNEFSAAAFRFGHSSVDGRLNVEPEVINIPDVMFNPSRLRQRHFYDELFRGLSNQPMQEIDSSITHGLTRYLFRAGKPFGLDLASLNIQRGRDHALRSYNDYLEVSGRSRIKDFMAFGEVTAAKLSSVYKFPDDIDLWVGGLMEKSIGNGILGPTFSEIVADQFVRFKKGDRYYHENGPNINPGHFTLQQLNEIRKTTLARIICDNADHVAYTQAPYAFMLPGLRNDAVFCNSDLIPRESLYPWSDV